MKFQYTRDIKKTDDPLFNEERYLKTMDLGGWELVAVANRMGAVENYQYTIYYWKREIPEPAKEKEEVSAYSKEFYSRIKNYPDLPK